MCANTIPLVLLCKELILVWPRAAQPLFAPQNERIINSETEANVFFPVLARMCRVLVCRRERKEREEVSLCSMSERVESAGTCGEIKGQ